MPAAMAVAIITQGSHFGSSRAGAVLRGDLVFAGRSRGTREGGGFSEVIGMAADGREDFYRQAVEIPRFIAKKHD